MSPFQIIKSVRLTEKASIQSERHNQYTVVVDVRATKPLIRRAVADLFKVGVLDVSTQQVRGKARRQRTRQAGETPRWKKAIVTLKDGDRVVLV